MLKHLLVTNIAIVERIEIALDAGLTVITGESGSGKSILIDAISLAFGEKVSPKDVLRAGCERGQVELLFDAQALLHDPVFHAFLQEQGIECAPGESEILISRDFTPTGSRFRINGMPVTREVLTRLRPFVVDLHGQHELTSLFQAEQQRDYLDGLGDGAFQTLKAQVGEAYGIWQQLCVRRERILSSQQDLARRKDFLNYQLQELTAAELSDDQEDTALQAEREILRHAEKLQRLSGRAHVLLLEGDVQVPPILDQLSDVTKSLAEGASYDPRLQTLLDHVESAHTELKAAASELGAYHTQVDLNPERLSEITDRLDILEKLKRKYGPTLGDVLGNFEKLQSDWDTLEADDADMEALAAQIQESESHLQEHCAQLAMARTTLAGQLEARLSEQLKSLALPSLRFAVQLEAGPYTALGTETVTFMISANPGEPLKPLAKVASGGELSRFLLALKAILAEAGGVATLVFDEIDSGVSGPTAKAVAERLNNLSRHLQVLVITHQPMIAALGQHHWHVQKHTGTDSVRVEAAKLDGDPQRLAVLGRLVSGSDTSDEAVEKFVQKLMAEARACHDAHVAPPQLRQA